MSCLPAFALALASAVYVPPAVGPDLTLTLAVEAGPPSGLSREAVARKAVAGMAKLGFRYAGVDADGHAHGYSGAASAVVLVFTIPDGRSFPVVHAAGWSGAEAERVKAALHAHLTAGPDDPAAPREVGTPVPQLFRKSPPLRWHTATRPASEVVARYLDPALSLALEKTGMRVVARKPVMALGAGGPGRVTNAFVLPGPNAVSATFACVATAPDEGDADRGGRLVLAGVLKILFE